MKLPSIGVIASWASSSRTSARLARGAAVTGGIWTAVQFLDRFDLLKLPDGGVGIFLFSLLSLALWEATELIILEVAQRNTVDRQESTSFTPEEAFAAGILRYAEKLNADDARRDTAVLDLRSWASRTLHLIGANQARHELGRIALSAAMNIDDRLAQASILIDELGWTCHLLNDDTSAIASLERAQTLLDELDTSQGAVFETQLLRVKAARHVANIRADHETLEDSRRLILAARRLAEALPGPSRSINIAQIDHSEGSLILKYLDETLGTEGRCDPQGPTSKLLQEGIGLANSSLAAFATIGDKEREMKVALLLTGLLRHSPDDNALRSARQRLARLKQEAERTAYIP